MRAQARWMLRRRTSSRTTFVPEGPARPHEALRPPRASEALGNNPDRQTAPRPRDGAAFPHGNDVPWNRRNSRQLARCKVPTEAISYRQAESARGRDFWLKPRSASPLGLKPSGLRRAKALFCHRGRLRMRCSRESGEAMLWKPGRDKLLAREQTLTAAGQCTEHSTR
jgi:hypothetical protein